MSDNGKAFSSKDFTDHLAQFYQISKFAGVGAHHHNAQAERSIRTIMSIARTMLIHAGIHWPDMARTSLWPMAVKHACLLWNHVPSHTTGLSPADIFTKTRWPQRKFHDLHVWGCPTYVLNKALQDGMKIPRWKPRSERCVYVGHSDLHSSQVPTVLSPSTGSITPQYHVVFDDYFATVGSDSASVPDFGSKEWDKLFGDSIFQYVIDDEEAGQENQDQEVNNIIERQSDIALASERKHPTIPLNVPEPPSTLTSEPNHPQRPSQIPIKSESDKVPFESMIPFDPLPVPEGIDNDPSQETAPSSLPASPVKIESHSSPRKFKEETSNNFEQTSHSTRRSSRNRKTAKRLTYTHDKKSLTHANIASLPIGGAYICCTPQVFKASKSDSNPDIFTYDEAMNGEHREDWIKAAQTEVQSLEKLNCWSEIPIAQATGQILPGTWVFRVKRAPDGTFKKFKARFCICGDLQEGTFDTYAPVVQFSSVRLFLAWSLILNWYTCSVDFSSAFIQAELKEPTFIHVPRGFKSSLSCKSCLKLNKSIYGLSVAPRLWFEHLWTALKAEGLKQSKHDPCLLFRHDLIVICYVDDLGLQAPTSNVIDELMNKLKRKGFEMTIEGSFTDYLGIQYKQIDDTTIEMTQRRLIDKILDATDMQACNPNKVPSTKEPLKPDDNGLFMKDSWNYRSIVGMLLYLTTNTRPDIAFAVSQVARYSHAPKESHAKLIYL